MLQNRVDPGGNIFSTGARGQWMGNRGCIHNNHQQIARPSALHAWITCRLAYKNQRLPLMTGNHNTQLFFLDEATALSAGHRPCAFCRREDFNRFKSFWLAGNTAAGFSRSTTIKPLDDLMHAERIDRQGHKITYTSPLAELPPGAFVLIDMKPHLLHESRLYPWTAFGYQDPVATPSTAIFTVLTPRTIVNTLTAGYQPQIAVG